MVAIHWFKIPNSDIERAKKFYDTILDADIQIMDLTESQGGILGMLPARGGVTGTIVQNSQYGYVPSKAGSRIYLVVDDIDSSLSNAKAAGGKVLLP